MEPETFASGGIAQSALVGESGPETVWLNRGDRVSTSTFSALAARLDRVGYLELHIAVPEPPDDDGLAGVPAKV